MRLQSKIVSTVLPLLLCGIFSLGWLAYEQARQVVYRDRFEILTLELQQYALNELHARTELLRDTGLSEDSGYLQRFQQEAITSASDLIQRQTGLQVLILNGAGDLVYASVGKAGDGTIPEQRQQTARRLAQLPDGSRESHLIQQGEDELLCVAQRFAPWDWIVYVAQHDGVVTQALAPIRNATFSIAAGSTFVTFVLMLSFARRFLLTPVRALKAAASDMAKHQPVLRIPVAASDELGELARGLEMTSRNIEQHVSELEQARHELQQNQAVLEQRVASRTEQLSQQNVHLHREIDERECVESALRREKQFSESIVITAQAMVLVLDDKANITLFNPFLESITGYSAEEVLGKNWISIFIPEDQHPEIESVFHTAMREGFNRGYVSKIMNRHGELLEVQWYGNTMNDESGSVVGLLSIGHDITEQRAKSEALKQARQDAEQANAGKGRFLAAASHDLRQPLQALMLLNRSLARRTTDRTLLKVVDKQSASLDAMKNMLDTLLDINQLETGSITPTLSQFPADSLLARLRSEFTDIAETKGLRLRIVPCSAILFSDLDLLCEIARNLVGNAIKYTQEGAVLVGCRRRGDQVIIQVSDTELGIPEEKQHDIFEEFYQVDNPQRDRSRGLGLAIVYRLARLLKHPIELKSNPRNGSTFSVTVPSVRDIPAKRHLDNYLLSSAGTSEGLSSMAILCIDDDPHVLESLQMVLELEGATVRLAGAAGEALAVVADKDFLPDVIITDYHLPCGDTGPEVVKKVREVLGRVVPAVVMTGDIANAHRQEAERLGLAVMHKPVDGEELVMLLQTVLNNANLN